MKCPRCDVDLKSTGLGKQKTTVIDVCPDCRGAWFDEGDLGLLEENMWTDTGKPAAIKCPRCGGRAEPLPFYDTGELVVERCTSCKGLCLGVRQVYG
ncbi:MAG: hypothetical protein GXP46_02045 [Deferribacteres bacterium]|nr:hypothetical protein [Deferribacteres bacterium]